MGALKKAIERIKRRQKDSSGGSYSVGPNPTREMMFSASLMIYQNANEIYVGKNRIGSENGFMELSDVIELIVTEYFRTDLTEILTPSACFNVPIKKELDEAIREVLRKHKIIS